MATVARDRLEADIGVSITGIKESDEVQSRPIGTIFIGIDDGETKRSFVRDYSGRRSQIKQRAVTSALFELEKILGTNY